MNPCGCGEYLQSVELNGKRPLNLPYPKRLTTIGHHIRKARHDRNLNLKQAASLMEVDDESIINWEKRHKEPGISSMAKIISFLGYIPFDNESDQTLGGRLQRYRLKRGVSKKRLAKILKCDPSTLNRVEGNSKIMNKTTRRIENFLLGNS